MCWLCGSSVELQYMKQEEQKIVLMKRELSLAYA